MTTTTRSAHASRRAEREAARLAERRRAERRRRRRLVLSVVGSVLLVAGLVGVVIGTMQHASGARPGLVPPQATTAGGIVVGSPTAPVKVIAYEDPQCPTCRDFERVSGGLLAAAVREGRVSVEYRMRSFLGPESVRAVNALAAAQSEGQFEPLRELLYANQPVEHTGGYSTETLLALGRQVGLTSSEYADAVRNMSYASWVLAVDDRASQDGHVATPELIVNGRTLRMAELFDAGAFTAVLR